jgi:ribonuclease Y
MGQDIFLLIVLALVLLLVVLILVAWRKTRRNWLRAERANAEAQQLLENARKEIENQKKEALLEAKDEALRLRNEIEREHRDRKAELQRTERRLVQKEETLDRRLEGLEKKEKAVAAREADLIKQQEEAAAVQARQREELERISGLSREEARELLLRQVEEEIRDQTAQLTRRLEEEARAAAERKARDIVTLAIQRCAVDQVVESTVSVVPLPSDDMKGRIIGREGRNIRAFEMLTGVDLIIDDTPEAVVISGFDPIRREVARLSLETLIADGRIHPARIEEVVQRAKAEVEEKIQEGGERAAFETGVTGLHPELVRLLGKLRYRSSYGQNVLEHSIEVSHLTGMMAEELGLNAAIARRGGLLHDIGKAVDFEVEGPHAAIGVDLAKHYREPQEVLHAIGAHHEDEEFHSMEAVLVHTADAISAARPGARGETLEHYLKRLQKLEEIADSCAGVDKSYAIQAGREIRIMVKPEEVDDLGAVRVAKDLVNKIEEELQYPGQIKVTVIRETRAVEYAK